MIDRIWMLCAVSSGLIFGAAGCGGSEEDDTDGAGAVGSATGELLALTYNVAGLPALLSSSEPETNMPLIGPLLNDYDLVLVQEDWLTPDPNPIPSARVYHDLLAAEANHPYQSVPAPVPLGEDPRRPSALLSDGLNEFSNFPFGELTRVPWVGCFGGSNTSDGGAADCLAVKGFSVALHELGPGVEVDVYNLHAEAGATDEDNRLNAEDFVELATFIAEHSPGRALIVGGDTNLGTEPGSADADVWNTFLSSAGLSDVCEVVDCGADGAELDKFAFRSSDDITIEPLSWRFEREKFVRADGAPLSDHDALAVRFRWTAR
jgi:hypothetical protein